MKQNPEQKGSVGKLLVFIFVILAVAIWLYAGYLVDSTRIAQDSSYVEIDAGNIESAQILVAEE